MNEDYVGQSYDSILDSHRGHLAAHDRTLTAHKAMITILNDSLARERGEWQSLLWKSQLAFFVLGVLYGALGLWVLTRG